MLLPLKASNGMSDVAFDDVVSQDHANWFASCEKFRQTQRFSDSAFAFLVSVIQVLQSEIATVAQ